MPINTIKRTTVKVNKPAKTTKTTKGSGGFDDMSSGSNYSSKKTDKNIGNNRITMYEERNVGESYFPHNRKSVREITPSSKGSISKDTIYSREIGPSRGINRTSNRSYERASSSGKSNLEKSTYKMLKDDFGFAEKRNKSIKSKK